MNQEMTIAIREAIQRENQAYDLYVSLIKIAEHQNTQRLFNILAMEELKHAELLKETMRCGDFRMAKQKVQSRQEELTITNKLNPTVSVHGLREGFELALRKEVNDEQLYLRLMNKTDEPQLKDMFTFLAHEEKRHTLLLRKEFSKI